jgi:hypothetical protein
LSSAGEPNRKNEPQCAIGSKASIASIASIHCHALALSIGQHGYPSDIQYCGVLQKLGWIIMIPNFGNVNPMYNPNVATPLATVPNQAGNWKHKNYFPQHRINTRTRNYTLKPYHDD